MKKRRKGFIAAIIALVSVGMFTACVQNTGAGADADYRIAIVKYVDDASLNQIEAAIVAQLEAKEKELGVTFDVKCYNGQADGAILNQIASEVAVADVDVIVPIATPAAVLIQSAVEETNQKVVFSAVTDPVGAGLLTDEKMPGGNITGVSDAIDTAAILDLMLMQNPDLQTIGLLYDKGQASSASSIADAKKYCEAKGIRVIEKTGTNTSEIQAAADALAAAKSDAIFTPQDNTVMVAELSIFEKFTQAKIPHYTGADSFALNGAFLGYGVNYVRLGSLTADMVIDVTVNGKNPAETAVRTLSDGIITINTETAKAIGIDPVLFQNLGLSVQETTTKKEF